MPVLDFKYDKRKKNLVSLNKYKQYPIYFSKTQGSVSRKACDITLMPLKSTEGHRSLKNWKGQVLEGRSEATKSLLKHPFPKSVLFRVRASLAIWGDTRHSMK